MELRNLRTKARMSQVELSMLTGIPRWRLSLAENDQLVLRPAEQSALREALWKSVRTKVEEVGSLLSQQHDVAG